MGEAETGKVKVAVVSVVNIVMQCNHLIHHYRKGSPSRSKKSRVYKRAV